MQSEGAGLGDQVGLAKEPRLTSMLAVNQKVAGSCEIEKFNDVNKSQLRILLITNQAVYNIQRNENFIKSMMSKLVTIQNKFTIRRRIPLQQIEAITISNQDKNDEFVLHVLKEHDYRFKMQDYDLKVNLLKCICLQYERLTHKKIAFYFKNDLTLIDYCTHKCDIKAKRKKLPKEKPVYLDMQDLIDYQLPGVEFKAVYWAG